MANEKKRKKKHFIAVLGTGCYQPCTYYYGDQEYGTKFVQEAVLMLACGELCPGDRITVCLTEGARSRNWEDRIDTQREIEAGRDREGEIYRGFRPTLEACLKDMPGVKIEEKSIATGKNNREMAGMFSDIYETIGEDEEIYFDITHGLRNIPMLVMTILEYARVTKRISIGGIYYGAFEVSESVPGSQEKRVPVFDLTFYHTILNWTNAANSFIQYGHANEIRDLADEKFGIMSREYKGKKGKKGNFKDLTGNLNNVANRLLDFSLSLETGRGNTDDSDNVKKCYERYVSEQKTASGNLIEEYYPFRELLEQIERKMGGFKGAETNFEVGMAAVDWCIDNHMTQQGYTALDETVKTFLCEKLDVPQNQEFWRETVVKRLCSAFFEVVRGERKEQEERFEEWKLGLQRENKDTEEERRRGLKKGEELFGWIVERENAKEMVQLMDKIGKKRNDVNHFGFTNGSAKAVDLSRDLRKLTENFKHLCEKWDV